MPSPDLAHVRALEERSFNAWPARQTVFRDGWILRICGGFTKRANSANALSPGAPLDGLRVAAEALYAGHGLPAIFRLSPLASPQADRTLEQAGYTHLDPSRVLTAGLDAGCANPCVHISRTPSSDWLQAMAAASAVAPQHRALHHALVQAIALPAAFATLRIDGEPVAFGLGVLERGAVGLYELVVTPPHRGRGHGRTLVLGLLDWGRQCGASSAYLQVSDDNTGARALYEALGFAHAYGYHYRVAAAGGSAEAAPTLPG